LKVRITDLTGNDDSLNSEVARMLVGGFSVTAPDAFPDHQTALGEVRESFDAGRMSRVALDQNDNAVGWIGGISHYKGHAWELHPLVVRPDVQRRGIGRALVLDFEQCVVERGALTIFLGTDDEQSQTSLGGVDLYPDVWPHLRAITNIRRHPYEFYQKLGYVIVGVIPDANGFGKPDIFMAKRVGRA
jgi:aminoglycoside 6'-N-acetyltransferase I